MQQRQVIGLKPRYKNIQRAPAKIASETTQTIRGYATGLQKGMRRNGQEAGSGIAPTPRAKLAYFWNYLR